MRQEHTACPVSTGERCELTIDDLGIHGEGIGKYEGFTLFVPGALPGETVRAAVTTVKKSYAIGRLEAILTPSEYRTSPACPVYADCGGCQISHLTYEGQLRAKWQHATGAVSKIGGYPTDIVRPVLAASHPFGYRNKMAVPAGLVHGRARLGYYRQGSHAIIPTLSCAIQQEANNRLLLFAETFMNQHGIRPYDEKTRKGCVRHIMGRVGDDGKLMAVIVTATAELPCEREWIREMREALPEMISLYHNVQSRPGNVILGPKIRCLWGAKTLPCSLCGLRFEVSPYSFFQVNPEQAEVLYRTALDFAELTGEETVIDAYCGTGTISLCLARKARRVIGIEIVPDAIRDAKKNAKANGIGHAEFYAADAGKLMPKLYEEGLTPDVIVCDPVRAGCSEDVLRAAAGMKPKRIVYVSCNPATFARDAARLRPLGYTLVKVQPVDMFPQTTHVELVSLLVRNEDLM